MDEDEIVALQERLEALGYEQAAQALRGVYDSATADALRLFQEDSGLAETGVLDDETRSALDAVPMLDPVRPLTPAPAPAGEASGDGDVWAGREDHEHFLFAGFAFASAALRPEFDSVLDELADYLNYADMTAVARIVGHTSSSGPDDVNQAISECRAKSISDALIARGVDPGRLLVRGEGKSQVRFSEDQGPALVTLNRRVEVTVGPWSTEEDGSATPERDVPVGPVPPPDEPVPPQVPVKKIIIWDGDRDDLDEVRGIALRLPDWLVDMLEFSFVAGELIVAGWSLATILQFLPYLALGAEALGISGDVLLWLTRLAPLADDLTALEKALQELDVDVADGTGPEGATPSPPQDAGAELPAGMPSEEGIDVPLPGEGEPVDLWSRPEFERGREIENQLAITDYADFVRTDDLPGFEKARNFPLVDFVSADRSHSVSVKTYNPFAGRFAEGETFYTVQEHAEELVGSAPGTRVTLDIRVPTNTPAHLFDEIRDTVLATVDDPDGRFDVVVSVFPPE